LRKICRPTKLRVHSEMLSKKTPNFGQFLALEILRGGDRGNMRSMGQNYSNIRPLCQISWQSSRPKEPSVLWAVISGNNETAFGTQTDESSIRLLTYPSFRQLKRPRDPPEYSQISNLVQLPYLLFYTGSHIHCVSKKRPTLSFAVTLTNTDRFSKFFH